VPRLSVHEISDAVYFYRMSFTAHFFGRAAQNPGGGWRCNPDRSAVRSIEQSEAFAKKAGQSVRAGPAAGYDDFTTVKKRGGNFRPEPSAIRPLVAGLSCCIASIRE
jgi:hypothetical protein